ncbi:MAG TPA: DUF1127 domain-containing protein [Methylomirabilota bacterium]|nr:DUF1127 domain-containing protein [Methylomirabilota bacterium]
MSFLSNLSTWLRRSRARHELLQLDDRRLADIGYSRALLEAGVSAWPWRLPAEATTAPMTRARPLGDADYVQAIAELRASSDADLRDLGISRAGIEDAVRYGRPDYPEDRHPDDTRKAA